MCCVNCLRSCCVIFMESTSRYLDGMGMMRHELTRVVRSDLEFLSGVGQVYTPKVKNRIAAVRLRSPVPLTTAPF